jgi:hypothetical protein
LTVVVRRGEEELLRAPFHPERVFTVGDVPGELRAAVRPGDRVTWAVLAGDRVLADAEVRVVDRPAAGAALVALGANRSLARQPDLVREVRAARVLTEAGLAAEALARLSRAGRASPDDPHLARGLVEATRVLSGADEAWISAARDLPRALPRPEGATPEGGVR